MKEFAIVDGWMTVLGFVAVLVFLYGPWQWIVVDAVRQRLFEIRDSVFDAAARGDVAFEDPHYIAFRASVNRIIRRADTSTFWRVVALFAVTSKADVENAAAATLSGSGRAPEIIRENERRIYLWLAMLMWLRSPVLIAASCVALPVTPLIGAIAAVSSRVRRKAAAAGGELAAYVRAEAFLQGRSRLTSAHT